MPHKKPHLPAKICLTCGRPFTWRKKWEKVWEEVKYCSERCRRERKTLIGESRVSPSKTRMDGGL